jgi:hypothetical protein
MLNFEETLKEIEKLSETNAQELMAKTILIRCMLKIFGRGDELEKFFNQILEKLHTLTDHKNYDKIEKKAIKIIEESGLNWLRIERDRLRAEKFKKEQEVREEMEKLKIEKKEAYLNSLKKFKNYSSATYAVGKGGKGIFKAFREFSFEDGSVAQFVKDFSDNEDFDLLAKENFSLLELEEKRKAFGKDLILKRQILIKF